ncbi:unnamed protein product [Rhodiola kirilowii]
MATANLLLLVLSLAVIIGVSAASSLKLSSINLLRHTTFDGQLTTDSSALIAASRDFGLMTKKQPMAVLRPSSADDIARLIKAAASPNNPTAFPVSARGHGHSINGQAQTQNGVVIDMNRCRYSKVMSETASLEPRVSVEGRYVDVWGGELWIDVLNATLEFGLAPRSWTDYLYLTVGGTLSNGGISGQAFNHGPQISNVHEMDVVSGKGELMTCSREKNRELFHAVLGGLGQFGIITRARIALERAPKRVKWIRVLYSNFSAFTQDQEYLISLHGKPSSQKFDYVEGFVIVDEGLINNWRSSFFSPRNPVKISSLGRGNGGVLYCLEITKNYDESNADSVDQEVEDLLGELHYTPATEFTTDLPYIDFLDRVHKAELKLRAKGLWDVPHPWLNLFIPKSKIAEFDKGVFKGILGNKTSGPILIYPMNKNKWEKGTSVVTPDEDVFYLVALLRSALKDSVDETLTLEHLMNQNRRILKFSKDSNIGVKQYLPHYTTSGEWMSHFGPQRWEQFSRRKQEFDPRRILATGQRIFDMEMDDHDNEMKFDS